MCSQKNIALEYLSRLKRQYPVNTSIDWEKVLEFAYTALLDTGVNVLDIGAHNGRHTDVFIEQLKARNVIAIEPLPTQFQVIQGRYADKEGVQVLNAAVGSECGAATFVVNRSALQESGLMRRIYNNEAAARTDDIDVNVVTLDSLQFDFKVDYIKIDVEGGEIDVLAGATGLLTRDRPVISVEYGHSGYSVYGYAAGDLYSFARNHDYDLSDLFGNLYSGTEEWLACVDQYYWDYLMFPRERAAHLSQQLEPLRLAM